MLEDALGRAEVDALIGAIDPFEDRGEEALRAMEGGRFFIARADEITFTTHLVVPSPVLRDFTASALLADVCADLIGPDVRLYWDQAVYKKPGTESPFPWHQDNGYAFVEPQQYLTCWVALTDATEDNGCPWVVPGLHRRGTLAHEYSDIGFVCLREPADAVPVPVRAGSIVVFSSLTPHSTGPNRTGECARPTSCSSLRRGPRWSGPSRGARRGGSRPTTNPASTRCCGGGSASRGSRPPGGAMPGGHRRSLAPAVG